MVPIPKGPAKFFRLSPDERKALGGFAVRRGEVRERLDVVYAADMQLLADRYATPKFPLLEIGSIATKVQYGTSARSVSEKVGTPVLRIPNLQLDGWALNDLKYLDLSARELASYRLEAGDILFNRTNGSRDLVGKCEVFDFEGDWAFASYLIRLRLDQKKANPYFVSAFLNTKWGRRQVEHASRQILMSNINAEEIRTLRIPLPDPGRQASLLATLNAARAARDARLVAAESALDGMDAFILSELDLTLPPRVPINPYAIRRGDLSDGRFDPFVNQPWYRKLLDALSKASVPTATLGSLMESVVGGATPNRSDDSLYAEDGIHLLRINNVQPNALRLDDCRFITSDVHENDLARSQLVKHDILMTITGRVGTAVVYDRDDPANINQHIVRLRLKAGGPNPFYLAAFLNSSFGLALSNRSVTGATRVALDYEAIRALPIPIPSSAVQATIVAEADRRRADARRLSAEARDGWTAARQAFEDALLGPSA